MESRTRDDSLLSRLRPAPKRVKSLEELCMEPAQAIKEDVALCWNAMRYVFETFCKDDDVFRMHLEEVASVLKDCKHAFKTLVHYDDPFLDSKTKEDAEAFQGILMGLEDKITKFRNEKRTSCQKKHQSHQDPENNPWPAGESHKQQEKPSESSQEKLSRTALRKLRKRSHSARLKG